MQTLKLLPFLLASSLSLAEPSVSSARFEGNKLIIEGVGFGASNPMLVWDDVEGHLTTHFSYGEELSVKGELPWRHLKDPWSSKFVFQESNQTVSKKTKALYKGSGKKTFVGEPVYLDGRTSPKRLYVNWSYKPSISPSAQGGSNKFIRIWDKSDSTGTHITWTQMHMTCHSNQTVGSSTRYDDIHWADWNGKVDDWNRHEFYVDLDTEILEAKVNGAILMSSDDCKKDIRYPEIPIFVKLIGFDHGSDSYSDMETWIDDIYIGSSKRRVEISNNATWTSTGNSDLLPTPYWSDTRIEAYVVHSKVKSGGFSYLYISDDNGNFNPVGIPIDCPACAVQDNRKATE